MTESTHIIEHFACDCSSIKDTVRFSYFLPLEGDEEADVIFMTTHIEQWRDLIFGDLYHGIKGLFSKEDRYYGDSVINKEFWKNYYYRSVWARFPIAWRHVMGIEDKEFSIYNSTIFRNEDLERMDKILTEFSSQIQPCDNFVTEVSGRNHRIKFFIEEIENTTNIPVWMATSYQFLSNTKLLKRLWTALKFIFGSCTSCYGDTDEFEIGKKEAARIRYIIQEVIRRNKEITDEAKDEGTSTNITQL